MTRGSEPAGREVRDGQRRIRSLVAVAVLVATTLGIVGATLAFRAYAGAKDDEVRRIEQSAITSSGDVAQFMRGRVLILEALATSDSLVRADHPAIRDRLARVDTADLSLEEGVAWFDAEGRARASRGARLALDRPAQGALAAVLGEARAGGEPVVSGSIEGSLYDEPVVALVVPTRDRRGAVNGTLVGAVGTAWLNERSVAQRAVRGGDTLIIDRAGRLFVAPGLRASRAVGDTPVARRFRELAAEPGEGATAGALSGVENPQGMGGRLIGFAAARGTTGWTLLIDRSTDSAYAGARRTLAVELSILALLVALGVGGALLLGRRLGAEHRAARAAEERMERLQAMTAGLSAASTPAEVAHAVLKLGQAATGADAGSIALLDAEGAVLTTLAMVGYSDRVERAFPAYPVDAPLPMSESIREGPVWLPGAAEVTERYPHLAEFRATMSHEAVASMPLAVEGRVMGGLALSFPRRRTFGPEERAFLTSVADLSAQALDRARLYEAEQRETGRQQLLAEASVLLGTPVEPRETLTELARLSVPRLADWCSVSIPTADGIEVVAVAHTDPGRVALARGLTRRFPPVPGDATGVATVLRTGRPEFAPVVTREMIDAAVPPGERRDAIHALGLTSVITVPLSARGRTLGALVLAAADSGRHFSAEDLAFAEDLGARAGLAIDNATLLDRSREIAHTLQASLLPARLPAVEGVDVAARYVAGGEGVEVGGDFYDLFPLEGGRGWAAVLGDVCGKGTEAAALTALARHTIRAESDELAPSEVLGRLNRAVLRNGADSRFLTATYAWLWTGDGGLNGRLARGGHPPALVVRANGSVEMLCPRGPLLGVMADTVFAESAFALGEGDSLVLFSDGVVEARAASGELFGIDRLTGLVSGLAGAGAEAMAEAVEAALGRFQGAAARDDLALLIVKATGYISPSTQG